MKKIILCSIAISSLLMASCSDYAERRDGIIMVGNKPYKLIVGQLDNSYFKMIVPVDSTVTIVPENITYKSGKTEETVIYVK